MHLGGRRVLWLVGGVVALVAIAGSSVAVLVWPRPPSNGPTASAAGLFPAKYSHRYGNGTVDRGRLIESVATRPQRTTLSYTFRRKRPGPLTIAVRCDAGRIGVDFGHNIGGSEPCFGRASEGWGFPWAPATVTVTAQVRPQHRTWGIAIYQP